MKSLDFAIVEYDAMQFNPNDYYWILKQGRNPYGNLWGYENDTKIKKFTYQPGGTQFTIHYRIPTSAQKFKLKAPPVINFEKIMAQIKYDDSWVTIL